MDGAWWMLSGLTISSDSGKYTAIIDSTNFMVASENYLGVWTTIWPGFTFRRMLFLVVPPTSSIVEPPQWLIQEHGSYQWLTNKSESKLSAHTITPQNDIGEWFTAFRRHGINHLFQTAHWCYSIVVWVFGQNDYSFIPYLLCYTFKITIRCKEQKALISKVGVLDFIL